MKIGEVIYLFEKGNRTDKNNYQRINLLQHTKYAKIITQRLRILTEAIILKEQNGFRKVRPFNGKNM